MSLVAPEHHRHRRVRLLGRAVELEGRGPRRLDRRLLQQRPARVPERSAVVPFRDALAVGSPLCPPSSRCRSKASNCQDIRAVDARSRFSSWPSAQLVDAKPRCSRCALGAPHDRRHHLKVLFLMFGSCSSRPSGRAQPVEPERDVRRHGVDLPGRPPRVAARFHCHRQARDHGPDLMFCIAFGCRWTMRCSCSPASRRNTIAAPTRRHR